MCFFVNKPRVLRKLGKFIVRVSQVKIGMGEVIREDAAILKSFMPPSEEYGVFYKHIMKIFESMTNLETGLRLDKVTANEVADRMPMMRGMVQSLETNFGALKASQKNAEKLVDAHFRRANAPNR